MSEIYSCHECNYSVSFWNGIGYLYPVEANNKRDEALAGKYGKKLKAFLEENKRAVLDASICLYYCEDCKKWKQDYNLDVYMPEKEEKAEEYIYPWSLPNGYYVAKVHTKKCPKCRKVMAKMQPDPIGVDAEPFDFSKIELRCPKCGGELHHSDSIMID